MPQTGPGAGPIPARPDQHDFEQGYRQAAALQLNPDAGTDLGRIHHGLRYHAPGRETAGDFFAEANRLRRTSSSLGDWRGGVRRLLDDVAQQADVPADTLEDWQRQVGRWTEGRGDWL